MADIFVSYTSRDRNWAEWIGQQLESFGHDVHLDAWEIPAGGNIAAWMEEQHDKADHVLCVMSDRYLEGPFAAQERHAALWAAASKRPNFLVPVFIEPCEAPTLIAPLRSCELYGLKENEAKARLQEFLKPAAKPSKPKRFPGDPKGPAEFPGSSQALSNIPVTVPRHFFGREQVLKELRTGLTNDRDRIAITTLFGLRGVGKTTLAAAYAYRYRSNYLVTWWIHAEAESTMKADLVGLGVRLGWVTSDEKEDKALTIVMDRLRQEGEGILLVFDNAVDADSIEPYFPTSTDAHILVTSNADAWRDIATPLRIDTWPPEIGADYLVARSGREAERPTAIALSSALGGLPLAHEQAAAYCERLAVPLATYRQRFDGSAVTILSDPRDAPRAYHNRLTATKTFSLAIDEAVRVHSAAEALITYVALLAPEPIPIFLFSDGRTEFAEPFASSIADDGLDEAIAALRAFSLIDREPIVDERDPSVTTDCIRLHRLVRQIAATRRDDMAKARMREELTGAMATVYPGGVYNDPNAWLKARRLDVVALALVDEVTTDDEPCARILNCLADYRHGVLAAYAEARPYYERALAIREKALGADHPDTATSLNNLGHLLQTQGDHAGARPYYERALAIHEKASGADHPETATSLNNLGYLLRAQGDLAGARPYYERALAIREKTQGADHPDTATGLNNLGYLLQAQGDLGGARPYYERALAIREKALGADHPDRALSLNNLGYLLRAQGDLAGARSYYERALAIRERSLGVDHPDTANSFNNVGYVLQEQGDLAGARSYYERALAIYERKLGLSHPTTRTVAKNVARLFEQLKLPNEATIVRQKFGHASDD